MNPLISICIPSYKRINYLQRLLDSISIQTYKNFEVIVTDDSRNNDVEVLCNKYKIKFNLFFYKNPVVLDTPENWNEAIKKANGEWIKLMHDDDWFSEKDSLQQFVRAIVTHPNYTFFFSAYTNRYEESNINKKKFLSSLDKSNLLKNAAVLIADNVIGPPSVILHKKNVQIVYDRNMKYVVDIDFYIRKLKNTIPFYIDQSLINVGINKSQVTKYTFGVANVHLKESLILLEKTGEKNLKNIIVFDGWWRLMRNFKIKNEQHIRDIGFEGPIPQIIFDIIKFQKVIPATIVKNGICSKILMSFCYIRSIPVTAG